MYNHGITTRENPTSLVPPVKTAAGLQVIVGTAPINTVKETQKAVNKAVLITNFEEAVSKLGYSDDWKSYTLCQSMDASFRLFNVAPIVFINVLDPEEHKKSESKEVDITDGVGNLVKGIIKETVVIKNSENAVVEDSKYELDFDGNGQLLITAIDLKDGKYSAEYDVLDPSKVTNADIIGGYNASTKQYEGLEAIRTIYPKYSLVPGMILAPGWSHIPEIALVMDGKSKSINGSFNCINLLDVDASIDYTEVKSWKDQNSYTSDRSVILYPKLKVGSKTYAYSSIMGSLIAQTDATNDDVPHKSPSNKRLPITGTILANGEEVFLDQLQANLLNGQGIVTAINVDGWRNWGNNTGAYPGSTDPKDRFISIRRMFDWWGNTFIRTYFQKVDDNISYRLIETIVDSENIKANGLKAKGFIAGAKMEFRKEENPMTDILNGKISFIQKVGFLTPAKHIENVLEFDPKILEENLFGGGN
jgi:phage tail sheath protein FI